MGMQAWSDLETVRLVTAASHAHFYVALWECRITGMYLKLYQRVCLVFYRNERKWFQISRKSR